jgi:hypothetical protein
MKTPGLSLLAVLLFSAPTLAAEAPTPTLAAEAAAPVKSGSSLTLEGGLTTTALAAELDLHTRFGLVVGVVGGVSRGPAVGGHVAYRVPLGARWSLEPGVRGMAVWKSAEACGPHCQFDFVTLDLGLRYQGPSGFVFQAGLPLVSLIPVGPDPGQSRPHLEPYAFSVEAMAATASVLFGYSFDL